MKHTFVCQIDVASQVKVILEQVLEQVLCALAPSVVSSCSTPGQKARAGTLRILPALDVVLTDHPHVCSERPISHMSSIAYACRGLSFLLWLSDQYLKLKHCSSKLESYSATLPELQAPFN
jgi:hypothetical protein